MKKLVLSMVLLAGLTIVSCSKDDDGGSNSGCVTCDSYTVMGMEMPEQEVCKGENGNAFVDGEDTEMTFDTYVNALETQTECN